MEGFFLVREHDGQRLVALVRWPSLLSGVHPPSGPGCRPEVARSDRDEEINHLLPGLAGTTEFRAVAVQKSVFCSVGAAVACWVYWLTHSSYRRRLS